MISRCGFVEPVSIAVNAYRNNDSGSHPTAADGGTQDALSIKDALAGMSGDVHSRAGGAVSYVDVFTGKGTPEAIAAVMQCFYDYSDRFISTFGKDKVGSPRRKCADWLADEDTSWQDTLQTICHEFIGLDCNGFVGNWLKRVDHSLLLGPQQGPREPSRGPSFTPRQVRHAPFRFASDRRAVPGRRSRGRLQEGGRGTASRGAGRSCGAGPRRSVSVIRIATGGPIGVLPSSPPSWVPSQLGCQATPS